MTEKHRKKEEAKERRTVWLFNPKTRCKESGKRYNRQKTKKVKELYDE